jgi:transcriptional regulator with XRE-family HTH domain
MTFGQALSQWRQKRGLSQNELANRAGVPRPNVSALERDRRDVSLKTIRALAAALQLSPGMLVDGRGPVQPSRQTSREDLESIANQVLRIAKTHALSKHDAHPSMDLAVLLRPKLEAAGWKIKGRDLSQKRIDQAWQRTKAIYPSPLLESLISRIIGKAIKDRS